jgi:uncharacterized membrane protein YjfL (UPF0719 family)
MIKEYAIGIPDAIAIMFVIAFWVSLLWRVLNMLTKFDDNEQFARGNIAYALQRVGLCAAQVIAMLATISGYDTADLWRSVGWMMVEGLYISVALILSMYVVDYALLPKISNQQLLLKGNVAVGIVEAGAYAGLGFLLAGSLTGTASSNWLSFWSAVVFYLSGFAFVIWVYWLHEWITPYSLRGRLRAGNVGAAVEIGSLLLATSIVVGVGVAGDFTGWLEGFKAFGLTSVISIALLYPSWWLLNKFGPGQRNKDAQRSGSLAAVAVSGGFLVLAAFVVASVVQTVI